MISIKAITLLKYLRIIYFIFVFYYYFFYVKVVELFIPRKKNITNKTSVLYLAAFFPNNAGFVYRVKKWSEILLNLGYNVEIKYALTEKQYHKYLSNEKVNEIGFYL